MHKLIICSFVLMLLFGCSSQVAFTTKKAADVDSVLFYQQKDLDDPFIDSVLSNPGDSASISAILTPAPPPPPADTLRQIDGFRVQVFAGIDSLRAKTVQLSTAQLVTDSTYLVKDNGLFKIQVGDYLYRSDADSVQRLLTISNLKGHWVVKRKIFVRDSVTENVQSTLVEEFKFKIQIIATSDESRALTLIGELQSKFSYPSFYLPSGSVYKVFVGKFKSREQAQKALTQIREQGYPDAWLVY